MTNLLIGALIGALLCGATIYMVFPKQAAEMHEVVKDRVSDAAKPKYKWPNTEPPGEYGGGGLNVNGTQYKKAEVEPGKWQWVVDNETMKWAAEREQHRRELYWALRSRALTDDEMKEVTQYGQWLNIEPNVSYYAEEKARELNDALLTQYRIRETARSASVH